MRLETYIRDQGISVQKLADELGVSHEAARLYVKGKRRPSLAVAVKLEKLTGGAVKPADFVEGNEDQAAG